MSAALLEVDSLVAGYGATQVIHGLSIRVLEGGVTALLGANGAGKTTLMKALAGVVPVKSGTFRFEGADITRSSCDKRVLAGMVLVPEGRILGDVQRWLGVEGLVAGDIHVREALTVQVLPFVRQERIELVQVDVFVLPIDVPQQRAPGPLGAHERVFTAHEVDVASPQQVVKIALAEGWKI